MSRDYKHATSSKSKSRRSTKQEGGMPCWICFAAGLFVGLFVAGVIYLKVTPQMGKGGDAAAPPPAKQQAAVKENVQDKPRFDFYSILPNLEIVIPEQELREGPARGDKPREMVSVKQAGTYLLQAGSFRKFEEADRLKAELALLGIEADIETVTIDNSEKWHRVRIGPFSDLNRLNKVRQRLMENNVDVMLLKVKT